MSSGLALSVAILTKGIDALLRSDLPQLANAHLFQITDVAAIMAIGFLPGASHDPQPRKSGAFRLRDDVRVSDCDQLALPEGVTLPDVRIRLAFCADVGDVYALPT